MHYYENAFRNKNIKSVVTVFTPPRRSVFWLQIQLQVFYGEDESDWKECLRKSVQSLAANSLFDRSRLWLSNSNTWYSLTETAATNCSTVRFPHTSFKVQKSRQPPPVLHTRPAWKQFHRGLCKESRNESRVGNVDICLPLSASWICRRHEYLWGVFVWHGEELSTFVGFFTTWLV